MKQDTMKNLPAEKIKIITSNVSINKKNYQKVNKYLKSIKKIKEKKKILKSTQKYRIDR